VTREEQNYLVGLFECLRRSRSPDGGPPEDDEPTTTPEPGPMPEPTPEPTTPPSGMIRNRISIFTYRTPEETVNRALWGNAEGPRDLKR
jgi:hypothetical protein